MQGKEQWFPQETEPDLPGKASSKGVGHQWLGAGMGALGTTVVEVGRVS